MTYIIDASVILTSLLQAKSKTASKFKKLLKQNQNQKIKLYTSSLTSFEVANGLRFTLKDKELAHQAFQKYLQLNLKIFNLEPEQNLQSLKLAYQTKTTVYDSSYHLIARLIHGTFLTCDQKYYQKTKHLNHIELFPSNS